MWAASKMVARPDGLLPVRAGFFSVKASAVIFDLDGTLLDSIGAHMNSWLEACALLGIRATRADVERLVGLSADDIALSLVGGEKSKADELARLKRELFTTKWLMSVKEYPDASPTLAELRRRGKKLAVVTSTRTEYVDIYVTMFEIFSYVEAVITPQMVGCGKPSPEMAKKAAELLRVDPRECVVVGDTQHDIEMAKGAGMRAILLYRGLPVPVEADVKIKSLTELLSIIE